jgi:hypothetical protein
MKRILHVGGLVAAGFDATGGYLLTVSHSGRGVFSTKTWERLARDPVVVYPKNGLSEGIGPLSGTAIPVHEKDYATEILILANSSGSITLQYEDGVIEITEK